MLITEINTRRVASFMYGGQKQELIPSEMECVDGIYSKTIGALTVTLDMNQNEPDILSWTVRITNNGTVNSERVSALLGMDLTIPCSKDDGCVWRGVRGDSCDGSSFMPLEQGISPDSVFTLEPVNGRPSQITAFPFFDFNAAGRNYAMAVGWSGQWYCGFAREEDGLTIRCGQRDCDFYLLPNESVRSVKVLLYSNGGDVDDTRRGFRAALRKYYSPAAYLGEDFATPVSVQDFDRYFWNTPEYRTEAGQIKLIKSAAKCKNFNTFWLDAAWFREGFPSGVGNYEFAPGFAENGLKKISDTAHENGMKFMVWFEPERIHIGSDIYAAHGDGDGWLLKYVDGDENRLYNLGNPDALKWLTDTLIEFIDKNGIDIYREDFNIDPLAYWRANDTEGRKGITEMRFVEGFYSMWDAILARFPNIMIDNCASGGRRIDLETVIRAVPCWRSDTACGPNTPERPVSMWHQNQTVNLSRYLPYHLASSWAECAYDFRSGMTMGIACGFDLLDPNYNHEPAAKALAELVGLRKYWNGDFKQITEPSLDEGIWFAYQIMCGDIGFAAAFRRRECKTDEYALKLEIPDIKAAYSVTITGDDYEKQEAVCYGEELKEGLTLVSDAPTASFIVEYRKI